MMRYDFNADEIFEMAEQMERNGEKFYKDAAATIGDEAHKKLLLNLAAMEVDHEKTFKALNAYLESAPDDVCLMCDINLRPGCYTQLGARRNPRGGRRAAPAGCHISSRRARK